MFDQMFLQLILTWPTGASEISLKVFVKFAAMCSFDVTGETASVLELN